MNGIDVSSWQPEDITAIVDYDFVIIKATEGVSFISPTWRKQIENARSRGKKVGLYHFASGVDPVSEADFFVNTVKDYIGISVLVLDWEANVVSRGREWVRSFVNRIKETTNVPPIIYGSSSPLDAANIPELALELNCALWVAAYPNQNNSGYRDEPQLLGSVIRQYTSKGRLQGYNGNLDLNTSILNADQWDKYAQGSRTSYIPPVRVDKKSNEEVADEVISGKWGNGEDRKNRLSSAGYAPTEIQAIVNMKLSVPAKPTQKPEEIIANEVLGGLWGNGEERKTRLKEAGYNYYAVQTIVNSKIGVPTGNEEYLTVPSGAAGYLGNIASRFGTTVKNIVDLNKQKYPNISANYVQAGWVIRVK